MKLSGSISTITFYPPMLTVWSMSCRDRWNTTIYFPYTQPDDLCILHLNNVVVHHLFGKV